MPMYIDCFFEDEFDVIPYHISKSEIDLFEKIEIGDVNGVQKLLADQRTRQKININCFNHERFTPLLIAVTKGINDDVKQMIRILLEHGAQINIMNRIAGQTILHHACAYEFDYTADVVNFLLQNGAEPSVRDSRHGFSPLHVACINKNVAVAESLLLYNAQIDCYDFLGDTPLMQASQYFRMYGVEMLALFLENNASANLQNDAGQTALHMACEPLHLACDSENPAAVEMLLRHRADPNIRCSDNLTPLHYVCKSTCSESVQMLLEYNADVNCQDNDDFTPMHRLISSLSESGTILNCVQILLDNNVDLNIRNINGETPLLIAVRYLFSLNNDNADTLAVVNLLLTYGSDVNVQRLGCKESEEFKWFGIYNLDVNDDTPLHIAVRNDDINLVQMILNHNPDLQLINDEKQTVLDLAKDLGHDEIAKCIDKHLHKIRCQMYTFYRETWFNYLVDSPNCMKSISPVKKRKRKRKRYS